MILDVSANCWTPAGSVSAKDTYKRVSSNTPPLIKAMHFCESTYTRPGIATLEIEVYGKDAGIVEAYADCRMNNEDDNATASAGWSGKGIYNGTISIHIPISSNLLLGEYHVETISIKDSFGNTTSYRSFGLGNDSSVERL